MNIISDNIRCLKVSACLLLVLGWTVVRGTGASPSDRFRRQTQRFQNFPATPQQQRPPLQQPAFNFNRQDSIKYLIYYIYSIVLMALDPMILNIMKCVPKILIKKECKHSIK